MARVIYRPEHQEQLNPADKYGKYNCAAYVLAMFVDAVTFGGINGITGKWVRSHSSEPVPDTNPNTANGPGLNHEQLSEVADELHIGYQYDEDAAFQQAVDRLGEDRRLTISIWYPSLGAYRAQKTGEFGHELLAQARRRRNNRWEWLVNDPLAKAVKWVPESVIKEAAHEWGRRTGIGATRIRFGWSDVIPYMSKVG